MLGSVVTHGIMEELGKCQVCRYRFFQKERIYLFSRVSNDMKTRVELRIADPHHFNVDPDPAFYFQADLDPAFHLNADPDPAPFQSNRNLLPLVYRPFRAPF
jgi:hypothetical protein